VQYCKDREAKEISRAEMLALFECLYLMGTKKGHHTNVTEVWNLDGTGIEIFRATS
jgi:hypothetical protein